MPGEDEVHDYVTWVAGYNADVKTNQNFQLFNQSFWEISNLDFYDAKYEKINPNTTDVMRRAIYIGAEDAGKIEHIYFDHINIEGYRGSNSNFGKISGGIIYHVYTYPQIEKNRIPTWFEDLRVTNSNFTNLGREGINFHTPWLTRDPEADGGKWGTEYFQYYGAGEWTPSQNIYIGHNTFRNMDGEGILIDTCKNVTVEYNLVDTFLKNSGFAAGIFPWNSDDVYIQYNEACHGLYGNDAQGIEIDALNDRNYVQYNYVHDNTGGFIQWCTLYGYATYDSHYRYNISESDGQGYGTLTLFNYTYDCSAYNNTVFIDDTVTNKFINVSSLTDNSSIGIYNNIFYKGGETYKISENQRPANTTMDELFDRSSLHWENNLFYNFDFTGVSEEAITGNLINLDPKLTAPGTAGDGLENMDAYLLQEDSPAIGAGKINPDNGGRDYFGNSVPQDKAPDIGAHQYTKVAEDKALLQSLYEANVNKEQCNYTAGSWETFQTAM